LKDSFSISLKIICRHWWAYPFDLMMRILSS